jgi:hypothetical protein
LAFFVEISLAFCDKLGNNFLDNGVTDVSDMRFEETWQNVYITSTPHYNSLNVDWFIVGGM